METAPDMRDADPRIPRLAAGWEACSARLSPREGFLLSRIDGRTSWTLLREIAGLPPEEADRCFERWLAEGLVEVVEPAASAVGGSARERGIDPSLDLTPAQQREILAFEADLERPYHELLGVALDADDRAIKRAYFALSKKFHPDRYFRQRIGPFAERLERIFKKLVEAYELLLDPSTREELQRQARAPAAETPLSAPRDRPGPPDRRATLERLRRMFRIPEQVQAERRFKARQFFESYRVAAAQGRWLEAAASTRLAIAFDPGEIAYKQAFAEVQAHVVELRASELLERAGTTLDAGEQQEALRLCEEVIHYRPGSADMNHRAAGLALDLGEFEKAREYAEAACGLEPEVTAHPVLLCRVLCRAGLPDRAREALQAAERIDAKDAEVVKARRALGRSRGRGAR